MANKTEKWKIPDGKGYWNPRLISEKRKIIWHIESKLEKMSKTELESLAETIDEQFGQQSE